MPILGGFVASLAPSEEVIPSCMLLTKTEYFQCLVEVHKIDFSPGELHRGCWCLRPFAVSLVILSPACVVVRTQLALAAQWGKRAWRPRCEVEGRGFGCWNSRNLLYMDCRARTSSSGVTWAWAHFPCLSFVCGTELVRGCSCQPRAGFARATGTWECGSRSCQGAHASRAPALGAFWV